MSTDETMGKFLRSGRPPRFANRIVGTFVAVVAVATCMSCATRPDTPSPDPDSAEMEQPQRLVIVSPRDGQFAFTNRLERVFAQFVPSPKSPLSPVDATVTVSGPGGVVQLAKGDLREADVSNALLAFWDTASFEPGRYALTVRANYAGELYQNRIRVVLRAPPSIAVSVSEVVPENSGFRARFIAEAETEPPGKIASFRWVFGDDSEPVVTGLPEAEHVFMDATREYQVTVHVIDSLGGTEYATYTLNPTPLTSTPPGNITFQAATSCGCREMLLDARPTRTSTRYCGPAAPGAQGINAEPIGTPGATDPVCPPGTTTLIRADLGAVDPSPPTHNQLGIGFEVEAYLRYKSDPAKCDEGQFARGTLVRGGTTLALPAATALPAAGPTGTKSLPNPSPPGGSFTFNVINAPNAYPAQPISPASGPSPPDPLNFGADDYTAPSGVKKYALNNQVISWIDVPQMPTAGMAASDSREFISFVQGPGGTCWCRFSTNRTVNAAGATGGTGLTILGGLNCRQR